MPLRPARTRRETMYSKSMLVKFLRNFVTPRPRPDPAGGAPADPTGRAAQAFESGRRALLDGDAESARELLSEAVAAAPSYADAWFHLSAAHHAQGNLLEAGRCCERALGLDPAPQNWRDSLKNITTALGKPEEVDAWRAQADSHWLARLALGNALRRLDRLDEAEAAYRSALAASGGSPFAARRLACLLAITGRCDQADGYFQASAAIGLSPDRVLRLSKRFFDELAAEAPAVKARLPQLERLPAATSRDLVFVLSCDPGYFRKFAFAAVNSIRQHCTVDFVIHFHIVDPDDAIAADIAALRDRLGLAEVNTSYETAPDGDDWSKRTWYACARFVRLPALLRAYGKPVWLLDLDQIVVGDVVNCVATPPGEPDADIAMVRWHSTRWEPWEYFWASAVYAAHTPAALAFLDHAANYVAHHLVAGRPVWFLDQIALFAAHIQCGAGCRLLCLPPAAAFIANPALPAEAPSGTVFWSMINSDAGNAASLQHPVFLRYATEPAGP